MIPHYHGLISPKVLSLKDNHKEPNTDNHPRGHLDAWQGSGTSYDRSANYGIVLDDRYLVIDIDVPEASEGFEATLPETWTQKTRKGTHYLFTVPPGFRGRNSKLKNSRGIIFGDLKTRGYIVGPGSVVSGHVYQLQSSNVVRAPQSLLSRSQKPDAQNEPGVASQGIPRGEHDSFLNSVGGFLRGRHGLDEDTIGVALKGLLPVLQDVDPEDPYTQADIERLARSAGRYEAAKPQDFSPAGWKSYLDIETSVPLGEWWWHSFVPKGELVMLFGKGGIGKSSLISKLASDVLKKGGSFGFSGIEEPFLRFATRAMLGASELTTEQLGNLIDIGNQWKFPTDAPKLREALELRRVDVLYFDSIYGHFEGLDGLNMAERARHCLAPLSAIAQELGVTIVCTFHENKAGDFLGSVEMVNVARIVLKATREKGKDLKLAVHKTNFTEPEYALNFTGALMPGRSLSGETWKERNEEGEIVDLEMFVVQDKYKSIGEDEKEPEEDPRWAEIKALLESGISQVKISERLGIPRSTIQHIISRGGKIQYTSHIDMGNL